VGLGPRHDRRGPDAGEHVGQPALSFRVAKKRRGPDARLKNDDAEPARCQQVDERGRFGFAGDLADRRSGHGGAAHAAHKLGQFVAEARLEQPDARAM
jgi:hypothetical protein